MTQDLFANHLSSAMRRIMDRKRVKLMALQDEIGYAIGRDGGSAIDYWRRGHVPKKLDEIVELARQLQERGGFSSPDELEAFLHSAGHPHAAEWSMRLMPNHPRVPRPVRSEPVLIQAPLEPFVVGPAIHHPRQFFGREDALLRVFNLFHGVPMQHAVIIGPKRSGKTSLLHYLSSVTTTRPADLRPDQRNDWLVRPARYRWILVDFQNPRMRRRSGLFAHILWQLGVEPPANCNLDTFLDLASQNILTPTILMLDELNAAFQSAELDTEFWWGLRYLASSLAGGSLSYLLTAEQNPLQLSEQRGQPSLFFNIFGYEIRMGPFSEEEARQLIASSPVPFPQQDVEWMLTESRRWPVLLQKMCAARLFALQNGSRDAEEWKRESLEYAGHMTYLLRQS